MKHPLLFIAILAFANCSEGRQHDNIHSDQQVQWLDKRLTVKANDIALSQVIKTVADQVGMEIHGIDKLQGNVQLNFSGLPLNEGLAMLLQHANYGLQEPADPKKAPYILSILSYAVDDAMAGQHHTLRREATNPSLTIPASEGYVAEPYRKLYAMAAKGDLRSLGESAKTGDSAAQAIAIKLLARLDPVEAVKIASETAQASDPLKRLSAVQSLTELDGRKALAALGQALADPDFSIRQSAVLGLNNQEAAAAIPLLTEALHDPSETIRRLALDLLAERGEDAIAGLNQALEGLDPELRKHADELLNQMASER